MVTHVDPVFFFSPNQFPRNRKERNTVTRDEKTGGFLLDNERPGGDGVIKSRRLQSADTGLPVGRPLVDLSLRWVLKQEPTPKYGASWAGSIELASPFADSSVHRVMELMCYVITSP